MFATGFTGAALAKSYYTGFLGFFANCVLRRVNALPFRLEINFLKECEIFEVRCLQRIIKEGLGL